MLPKVETMLDYANVHQLHISEMPGNLHERVQVTHRVATQDIQCEPVQIVRDGDAAGVWRVVRLWNRGKLLGYVRFDLNDLFIYMRPGSWGSEEMVARWDVSAPNAFVSGLRNACETLLMYSLTK